MLCGGTCVSANTYVNASWYWCVQYHRDFKPAQVLADVILVLVQSPGGIAVRQQHPELEPCNLPVEWTLTNRPSLAWSACRLWVVLWVEAQAFRGTAMD